ncbi:acyl-CoA thioesterase [Microbacterium lushaniae]|uniref:acyl-CoA thioesterase n=1 Tax=Microbacterium lushaniae TaxID=2614639 RepID=UPI001EE86847|nr:acyl-CoA thioesterase II [Microbacterium lushaniae]
MSDAIDPVQGLLDVLDLKDAGARTTEDIFTGTSQPMPTGRVYGGQVLSQSVVAAARTLPADRMIHSMHGYFLRPGDVEDGITFSVDRIHDGRSFSTRRTQAYQAGVPIFSMIASFQDEDPGVDHHEPMPEVPNPEDLPDPALGAEAQHPMTRRLFTQRPVDLRHVPSSIYFEVAGDPVPRQAVWMRARRRLPDDRLLHRAALGYLSDLTIQEPILRAHGIPWSYPGLRVASLDHAMWWHRDARVDDWLLYVQESPSARGGRGLATGRIYTRQGVLAASVAQEIMVRIPQD